jgi:hypothetical protein
MGMAIAEVDRATRMSEVVLRGAAAQNRKSATVTVARGPMCLERFGEGTCRSASGLSKGLDTIQGEHNKLCAGSSYGAREHVCGEARFRFQYFGMWLRCEFRGTVMHCMGIAISWN